MNDMGTTDINALWEQAELEHATQSSARVQNTMKIEREDHKLEIFDDCEVAIRVETGQW